ncbi:FAD-binding oxidoreductase [Rhodococcoides yunnanense]|uniref:FAD-binding oxidoreductase n=1 Tax=Rhodococcoides yunnanense TaxID=278209 RepID=A0ABU4BI80_9NOCA|nr:FAD-binding oxidoreductase [Rhodococcus yunnanensis]MDV6263938.1 FAD-binding oxidoreductase [Rhodococcus yunnanensis]
MTDKNSSDAKVAEPVGVWVGQVHHDDQSNSYIISFARDGTISLRTDVTVGTGTWTADTPGRYTYELTETFTPASGHRGEIRALVKVAQDGDDHRGFGTAAIYTPDGALVHSTTAESKGHRVSHEAAVWHDIVGLGASICGDTLYPGDDGFEDAHSGWLLTVEHRPAAIVVAADAEDVATAVRFAADRKLPVAVESTGHGRSVTADGALLISTVRMRELSVDPEVRTARIGAGLRWADVLSATAQHGVAPLCGSSEQVGVMGYLTTGGLPMVCRTYGFAADHVRSIDLVTADGRTRTVTQDSDPDLFWAVRGGASNFGVVTAAELDLVPLQSVYGGKLCFPAEDPVHATYVLRSYLAWAREQPDEMSSSATLLRLPDTPKVPEELRGRSLIQVHLVHTGGRLDGERSIEVLRSLLPEEDTCGLIPYAQIADIHEDPKHPVRVHFRGALLSELDDAAVDALVSLIDPAQDVFPGVELRHMGGALHRAPGRAHAVGDRDAEFLLYLRVPVPAGDEDVVSLAADKMLERVKPWDTGSTLPGFLFDHDSDPKSVRRAYSAPDYRRLTRIKAKYDPQNLFRINHNIPPVEDGAGRR